MQRKMRRTLTGLAAGGVLVGALAGGGVALASGGPSAAAATTATVAAAPARVSQANATGTASSASKDLGRRFARHHPKIVAAGFRAAAADLSLTRKELLAQLRQGKSLAQVAAATGKSVPGLESAILAAATKVIDAHSGWTAAHQARLITEIKNHLNAVVNDQYPFGIGQHKAPATTAGTVTT